VQIWAALDPERSDSVPWTTLSAVVIRLPGSAAGKAAPLLRGVESQHNASDLTVSHEDFLRFAEPLLPTHKADFEQVTASLLAAAQARAARQRDNTASATAQEKAAERRKTEAAQRDNILAAERERRGKTTKRPLEKKLLEKGRGVLRKPLLLDLERENVEAGRQVRVVAKLQTQAEERKEETQRKAAQLTAVNRSLHTEIDRLTSELDGLQVGMEISLAAESRLQGRVTILQCEKRELTERVARLEEELAAADRLHHPQAQLAEDVEGLIARLLRESEAAGERAKEMEGALLEERRLRQFLSERCEDQENSLKGGSRVSRMMARQKECLDMVRQEVHNQRASRADATRHQRGRPVSRFGVALLLRALSHWRGNMLTGRRDNAEAGAERGLSEQSTLELDKAILESQNAFLHHREAEQTKLIAALKLAMRQESNQPEPEPASVEADREEVRRLEAELNQCKLHLSTTEAQLITNKLLYDGEVADIFSKVPERHFNAILTPF